MSEQVSQNASRYFSETGFYCAESVLMAVAEAHGVESDLIPRIATGFCSGIARTGQMCGAVSGAIMALGLAAGRDEPDEDGINRTYELVQAFMQEFENQFGNLSCSGLLGLHLGTPEGQEGFRAQNKFEDCTGYVGEAARIVMKLVGEETSHV